MDAIREVWAARRLQDFRPILRYWMALLDRIHLDWVRVRRKAGQEQRDVDCPWWYGERTQVGLLAAAAFQAGAIALEEYSDVKQTRKEGLWTGRTDLYIQTGSRGWVLEAKRTWISLGKRARDGSLRKVVEKLEEARADAAALVHEPDTRLGALFVVAAIPQDDDVGLEEVAAWLEDLDNQRPGDSARAAYFPERGFKVVEGSYRYPGVILLLARAGEQERGSGTVHSRRA